MVLLVCCEFKVTARRGFNPLFRSRIRRVPDYKEVQFKMYAIIETGGKQYKVSEGDVITVEKLGVTEGEYTFDKVLVVADGENVTIGTPNVSGASVTAKVLGEGKAKKVIVYKYKPKKGFHKKNGHRQPFTKLSVTKINA